MQSPLTVTFLGIAHSDSLEQDIRRRVARLDASCRDLVSCHVALGLPHRHHGKANPFSLQIAVTTPGEAIAVKRAGRREQLRVVIRDAFDVLRRRLQKSDPEK